MMETKFIKKNQIGDSNGYTRLCDLPDAILHYILTKLPTKDAVKASILSKKFENLWTTIGVLKINQDQFNERSHFMNFVERTLLFHDKSSIKEFHLSCPVSSDASRINAWISTIVRNNVEVLNLCLDTFDSPYKLPRCLFKSQTLKSFHLDMPCTLKIPSSISFSNLKTLSLSCVTFNDPGSTQHLLSSPLLEKLAFTECVWEIGSIRICTPKLLSLSIDESDVYGESSLSEIVIICAKLKSFHYIGELQSGFTIQCSTSLIEVVINFFSTKYDSFYAHRVFKILKSLSHVKDLTILCDCLQVLASKREFLNDLPLFGRLTELKLVEEIVYLDSEGFLMMLARCPCLTTLKLKEGIEFSKDSRINERILDPVPPCFLSHLKKIIIYNFCPLEHELDAPARLLEAARVLEKMIIHCESTHECLVDWPKKRKVFQRLRKLPKGSERCKVYFH